MSDEPMFCPHCAGVLPRMEMVAKVAKRFEVSMVLHPAPGELMSASTIGGCIEAFGKLMDHAGQEAGLPTISLIKSIATDEAGTTTVTLMVVRGAEAMDRKMRIKAAKKRAAKPFTPANQEDRTNA